MLCPTVYGAACGEHIFLSLHKTVGERGGGPCMGYILAHPVKTSKEIEGRPFAGDIAAQPSILSWVVGWGWVTHCQASLSLVEGRMGLAPHIG